MVAESPFWEELYACCQAFEGAEEAHPWPDHVDFRVKGKTFVFTSGDRVPIKVTAKPLPESREMFLAIPGVSVAAYVGRFGWLSMEIADRASLDLTKDMIAESYAALTAKKARKK